MADSERAGLKFYDLPMGDLKKCMLAFKLMCTVTVAVQYHIKLEQTVLRKLATVYTFDVRFRFTVVNLVYHMIAHNCPGQRLQIK